MNHLVTIVGPTGIGKSQLAIQLAQTFNGEIVGADSRQIYRYLDIGTAKPSTEALSLVPHHLINILNPDADFSLAQYQELAYRAIDNIQWRNKLPILVGGSGLYIWALIEGWEIPKVPPDMELRHNLEEKAAMVGRDKLYQELEDIDPAAAQRIDRRNVRRVVRALEIHRGAEMSLSHPQKKKTPPFNTIIIGLTTNRTELYNRIDIRVDKMIDQGLVAEVEKLVNMGYDFNLPAMSSIGYKQIGMFLNDELTLAAAAQQIKFETHRFVRQQYNWFRLKDNRINWFDIQNKIDLEISMLLTNFMQGI